MMTELKQVRQIESDGTRRWFRDSYFDLIVWYDNGGNLIGFQLCYDKQGRERAFTWRKAHGYQLERIDSGETPGRSPMTPVSVGDDREFPRGYIALRFLRASAEIDQEVSRFVYDTINRYPWRFEEAAVHTREEIL